jgi:flagellar basal-body rod protein FlgG
MFVTPLTLLHTAVSGMLAHKFAMDVTADNLANLNTAGFRPSRSDFQELIDTTAKDTATTVRARGTGPGVTRLSVNSGALTPGTSPLQLAIDGDGFFQVQLPNGTTGYSRDGNFTRDRDNNLVNSVGYRVVWQGALPTDNSPMHVNPDGTVMSMTNGVWAQVGVIGTARFANPSGLLKGENTVLLPSQDSGAAQVGTPGANGFGQIISGAIENSAANIADEMSNSILAQRAYSLSLKAFTQADEMISEAIHLRS